MDIYREEILDHYRNPRNKGELKGANKKARKDSPLCAEADWVEIFLSVEEGRIKDIKFQGKGCVISMAATSMLTERVKGKSLTDVAAISEDEIRADFGGALSTSRETCAFLSLWTLRSALGLKIDENKTNQN
ncbi:Fe-S cluster protein [candidate division WWE3 bacterium CG09_land_8_20_14_0_10_47_33]|uniref:Fe-S cluster protein n=1 Tax=candidate division WWE3 bacterium CG_4_9_14_0_2_um_filter_48_10 TaxID=1975078 RepID=A0A2M8EIX6_UNCKA|nr:MAG: Fe-S cluster protein [candidate division WWE3 bacterium CG09_land_8_20_14_0_10_47_33]PJC22711.1 MAG: Fe-S cluster protein [candidate division WWE3 bacterium CG_4_9_14_0_2_um_filter_48_10]PJE52240.1 MAG: Fe-S cluster protein [candidate division WWE3 bacterium CG10_big_fil_rev_8_21_14_0_10_48_23]